jgi:hypothetical protein
LKLFGDGVPEAVGEYPNEEGFENVFLKIDLDVLE